LLREVDAIVVDLQDLGARPYTYVSTLRLILEAAATHGTSVIVADRPIPLPCITDGPMLDPSFRSFVGLVPAPLAYGMTPAETALWLKDRLELPVDLKVAPMRNYHRTATRDLHWGPWVPPSPGIPTWESGMCYPATVFCEALPALDNGRGTGSDFQLLGAPWMDGRVLAEALHERRLPGVAFHSCAYVPARGPHARRLLHGLRLTVTDPSRFPPAATAVHIISSLHALYGRDRLWTSRHTRPSFFDALFGTDCVRTALLDDASADSIVRSWRADLRAFRRCRAPHLLYAPEADTP